MMLLLSPDMDGDIPRAVELADQALRGTEFESFRWIFETTKGLAECRAGRYADAVRWLEGMAPEPARFRNHCTDATIVANYSVLAIAHYNNGDRVDGDAALKKARHFVARMPQPARDWLFPDREWRDWVQAHLLFREAEGLAVVGNPWAGGQQAGG
jgi:hypothetical protein